MAETARENQVGSAAVKYETVADMGSGLVIAKVKLTDFREQDINARIMKTEMQKQLTDNIKKRGQLESLPFCALIDGKIEIISGHHRIRSAKDSGVLTELFCHSGHHRPAALSGGCKAVGAQRHQRL